VTFDDCTVDEQGRILEGMRWLGMCEDGAPDATICEDGSVYLSLTQVCPPKTINTEGYFEWQPKPRPSST
jgi:hypothetical protein